MPSLVSKSQFKAKALEYFRHVESSGDSVIVTDHGQPKLEVRPYLVPTASPLQQLKGTLLRYDRPTDAVGENDWEALR